MSAVMQRKPVGTLWLWSLLLAGPTAWILRLLISYGGIALACEEGLAGPTVAGLPVLSYVMLGIGVFFTVVALVATGLSWSAWRRLRLADDEQAGGRAALAGMAVFLNAFFMVTTAAETLGVFFLNPCR